MVLFKQNHVSSSFDLHNDRAARRRARNMRIGAQPANGKEFASRVLVLVGRWCWFQPEAAAARSFFFSAPRRTPSWPIPLLAACSRELSVLLRARESRWPQRARKANDCAPAPRGCCHRHSPHRRHAASPPHALKLFLLGRGRSLLLAAAAAHCCSLLRAAVSQYRARLACAADVRWRR